MQRSPWGSNTNFEMAMEKILQVAVEAKLNPENIPDLIVFSDMQFDVARSSATCKKRTYRPEEIYYI